MKKIEQFLMLLTFLIAQAVFVSCNNDKVTISEDGKASNGAIFAAIDDQTFYLDYIKYKVEEGHLVVSGYDKIGFNGVAKIVSSITYKGYSYEVLEIGRGAFEGCDKQTSVSIPKSVTKINHGAFSGCSGLTSIKVEKGHPNYDSRDNCNAIIETSTNTLIAGCSKTIIPSSVTSIGHSAFDDCKGLTSITIPNSVTSIGDYAFAVCKGLTSITIPNSVTSIGEGAFYGCCGLTSITIPNSVTSIGEMAFWNCSGLTSVSFHCKVIQSWFRGLSSIKTVVIGTEVTSIGEDAFLGCYGLTSIHCLGSTPPWLSFSSLWKSYPFSYDGTYPKTTLYVPKGSLAAYKSAEGWNEFKKIVEE